MQVIVTSYCRLKYLRQTVESLRQDKIELYIIDGGSDDATKYYIEEVADGHLFFDGNPGADVLKTEGIKKFVTDKQFMISSDDLAYPAGYSKLIAEQYAALNGNGPITWTFCACNMQMIEDHTRGLWRKYNGVEVYEVGTSQVAGAIIDTKICRDVGYFPVYGRTGQGDWAFSKRLRLRGLKLCYFRRPMIIHIGAAKWADYPEYSKAFKEDEDRWIKEAQLDMPANPRG